MNLLEGLGRRVTRDMEEELSRDFTEEEIKVALQQMHPTKAPGPDGLSPLFYQRYYWSTVSGASNHGNTTPSPQLRLVS